MPHATHSVQSAQHAAPSQLARPHHCTAQDTTLYYLT
eukprot:COSAG02_NODE_13627_length_1370_cov_1.641227_1_plen_36_part_10